MAFKLVESRSNKLPHIVVPLDGSTAITKGALLYADITNKVAKTATSSAGSTTNIIGVAAQTKASGATSVEVIPLRDGDLVEADCTANTLATHLMIQHVLTDGLTVNNTTTHSTDPKAVFFALALKGATGDKKLLGYVMRVGTVTA